jgi:TolA-binding protein
MLKPRKRLTKRARKEDKFVTFAANATNFLQQNWKQLALGIAAVLVVILVSAGWGKHRQTRENTASERLAEAAIAEQGGETNRAEELYAQVVSKFGRTQAGIPACTSLGALQFSAGKFDEAIATYRKALDRAGSDPLGAFAAYSGVGACLEEQGKYGEAAIQHRSYAKKYPRSPFAPEALSDAARCFMQAGRTDEAKATLEQIVRAHPKSQVVVRARSLLKML